MTRRTLLSLLSVLGLLIAATVLLAAREWRSPDPNQITSTLESDGATATADVSPVSALVPDRMTSDRVRRGEALALVLARQVPDQTVAGALVDAFGGEIDLRRVIAGSELEFAWQGERLLYVDYRDPRVDGALRVIADPSGYRAERIVLPADTSLAWYHGEVESSLYEAILARGGNAELAIKFFEIFQFTHYFTVDTRRGDRYAMLVEEIHRDGERIGYGRIHAARYTGYFDTLTAVWRAENAGGEYFGGDGLSFRRDLLRVPFPAARITSTYGVRRHPVTGKVRKHHGIDLAADYGTPVVAAGKGTVTRAERNHPGYGNWVHIRHGDTGFETRYGHFQHIARGIRAGSKVEQGTVIGYVGSTGLATGPHLHYEVFRDGRRLNPLRVKGSPVQKLELADHRAFLDREYEPWSFLLDSGELLAKRTAVDDPGPWPTLFASALFDD